MRKYIGIAAALASALPLATISTTADAGPGRHGHGGRHYAHGGYGGHYGHRGRGYWHNGRWIGLGIGAAIVGAAAAGAYGDGCYWRHGYRYCD